MKIPKNERDVIVQRVLKGEIYRTIAEDYGVSMERIRQIVTQYAPSHKGFIARREHHMYSLMKGINNKSRELFFRSGLNTYDIFIECLSLYKIKRYGILKIGQSFDVEFSGITWNRYDPETGKEIDYLSERKPPAISSLALINPNGGYVNGNVQTILRFRKSSFIMV